MSFTPPSKPVGRFGMTPRAGDENQLHQEQQQQQDIEQSFGGYARMKASPRPSMMAFSPDAKKPAPPPPRMPRQSLVERRLGRQSVGGARTSLGGTGASTVGRSVSGNTAHERGRSTSATTTATTTTTEKKPASGGGVAEFVRMQREKKAAERKPPSGMDEERMKAAQERIEQRKREREMAKLGGA